MTIDLFLDGLKNWARQKPDGFKLNAGVTTAELRQWKKRHPDVVLPDAYLALLGRSNGFELDTARFDGFNLLPLSEVEPVLHKKFHGDTPWSLSQDKKEIMESWVGIGLDGNGDWILAIDTRSGDYLQVGYIAAHKPLQVMSRIDAALAFLVETYDLQVSAEAAPKKGRARKSAKSGKPQILKEAQTLGKHASSVVSLAILPGTDTLISASRGDDYVDMKKGEWVFVNNTIRFWSLKNFHQIGSHPKVCQVEHLLVAPDGSAYGYHGTSWLDVEQEGKILVGREEEVAIFRSQSRERLFSRRIRGGEPMVPRAYVFPDGMRIVANRPEGAISIWNMKTGEEQILPGNGEMWAMALSHDGRSIVSGFKDGRLWLWDVERATVEELPRLQSGATVLAFTPDDQSLIIGMRTTKAAQVMNIKEGRVIRELAEHKRRGIRCLALCPDQKNIVSGGDDGAIVISDLNTGKTISTALVGGPTPEGDLHAPVVSAVVTPDGKLVFTGSMDAQIRAWELPV